MDTIFHLLSPTYLFARSLGPFASNWAWVFFAFNILLIADAVIIRRWARKKDIFSQKAAQKYYALAWTMGLIGLILWSFRQLGAFYISAPIGILIWLAILLVWLGFVLYYWLIKAPRRRRQLRVERAKKDYLP